MKKLSLLFVLSFGLLAQAGSEDRGWKTEIKKKAVWVFSTASALAIGVGAGSASSYLCAKSKLHGGNVNGIDIVPLAIIGGVAIHAIGKLGGCSESDIVDLYYFGAIGFYLSPRVYIAESRKNDAPKGKPLTGVSHEGFQDWTVQPENPAVDNNVF